MLLWEKDLYALTSTEASSLIQGALAQVKMILQDYGMKSSILMEGFITTGSRAIFLPGIAQQVWDLKQAMTTLKDAHGELFPYVRVFPLDGSDRLNHRNFPDLYYAVLQRTIKNQELGPEGRYIMTEITIIIPKNVIIEQSERSYKLQPSLNEKTRQNLNNLGIDPMIAKWRREEEEDKDERQTQKMYMNHLLLLAFHTIKDQASAWTYPNMSPSYIL